MISTKPERYTIASSAGWVLWTRRNTRKSPASNNNEGRRLTYSNQVDARPADIGAASDRVSEWEGAWAEKKEVQQSVNRAEPLERLSREQRGTEQNDHPLHCTHSKREKGWTTWETEQRAARNWAERPPIALHTLTRNKCKCTRKRRARCAQLRPQVERSMRERIWSTWSTWTRGASRAATSASPQATCAARPIRCAERAGLLRLKPVCGPLGALQR